MAKHSAKLMLPALIGAAAASAVAAIPERRSDQQTLWGAVASNIDEADKSAPASSGNGVRILLLGDPLVIRSGDASDRLPERFAKQAAAGEIVVGVPVIEAADDKTGTRRLALALVAPGKATLAYNHAAVPVTPLLGVAFDRASSGDPPNLVNIGGFALGVAALGDADNAIPRLSERGANLILVAGGPVSKEQVKRFATAARVHRAGLLIAGHCSGTPSCVSAAAIDPNGVIDWMGAHMHAFSRQRRWSPPSAFGLPLSVPQPARYTYSPAAAELGRILFFDKRVSETGSIACASCHDPKLGFSDGHRLGSGIRGQSTRRNTISLLNVAFRPTLRWDSYAAPLERFVQYPMSADDEMATHRLDGAAGRVGRLADYRAWFLAAFGTSHVSFEMIAQALATYIRSLVSGGSQFDRAVLGGQHEAMSGSAWRGYALFKGRAGCASCHSYSEESPFFTDSKTHNTGLGWNAAASCYSDVGAGATCASASAGSFRTPTLRDVARTGPYMHDGSIGTLRGVIDYFDGGGGCGPGRDPQLRALHLSEQDKSDLEAFLNALTGATSFDAAGRRRNPQFAAEH